jgi:hypothetical protein
MFVWRKEPPVQRNRRRRARTVEAQPATQDGTFLMDPSLMALVLDLRCAGFPVTIIPPNVIVFPMGVL